MSKFLMQSNWRAIACSVFILAPLPCFAQTSGTANQHPSAANQQASPEILKELEAMRHRIDELEAELKAQKTAQAPADRPGFVSAAFPLKTADRNAANPESSSLSPSGDSRAADISPAQEAAVVTKQTAPIIPEQKQPFSDADWTWLNGNPRTK